MARVVVFGHTEMARMTYFFLHHDSEHEVVAFTVDRERMDAESLFDLPIVAFEEVESAYPPGEFSMALPLAFGRGNKTRAAKYDEARSKGYQLISYVSSRATTWPGLTIGDNCFIFENSVVGPYTTIGNDVIIAGSSVGHDCVIGDHCFLAAGSVVLGDVRIGPYTMLGANSTCRDGITIGAECIIGAGATMNTSAPEGGVYVSKPAVRPAKSSEVLSAWLTWPVR